MHIVQIKYWKNGKWVKDPDYRINDTVEAKTFFERQIINHILSINSYEPISIIWRKNGRLLAKHKLY